MFRRETFESTGNVFEGLRAIVNAHSLEEHCLQSSPQVISNWNLLQLPITFTVKS